MFCDHEHDMHGPVNLHTVITRVRIAQLRVWSFPDVGSAASQQILLPVECTLQMYSVHYFLISQITSFIYPRLKLAM